MSQTRRLAAILAADVAGYLRLRMITAKHLCPERHVTRSVVTIVNADALELGDCLTRSYRRSPMLCQNRNMLATTPQLPCVSNFGLFQGPRRDAAEPRDLFSAPGVHGYADRIEVFQGTRLGSGEHGYEERGRE